MTILSTIAAHKKDEVAALRRTGLKGERSDAPRGFYTALAQAPQTGIIAEIKKASPSRGIIRHDFDPAALATAYTHGGAECLSVLTDAHFFHGDLRYLAEARNITPLPALRKDFIIDPLQIEESYRAGADAILLIVALLSDTQLAELSHAAAEYALDVLVEVHDEEEMARAAQMNPRMIGINNRNLHTFDVTLATTERLAPSAPPDALLVSESGIFTADDIRTVTAAGVRAVLVGESLMRAEDVTAALRALRPQH